MRGAKPWIANSMRIGFAVILTLVVTQGTVFANDFLDSLDFNHGIAFYHDLKYPADFQHFDYVNPEAPKGGRWVESTQTNFNSLSPSGDQGTQAPGAFWLTLDTLLVRAGDEASAFYGRLADGVAVTPDRRTVVFRIHPEARWHDGVPVTSRDVAFTVRFNRSQIEGGVWYGFMKSVEEIDDRHVALHLNEPLTLSNIILIQFMPILPAHYWSGNDPATVTLNIPLGSGPYRISSIKQGRYVEYERVADYWGRDLPVNRGRYNFDVLRYDVYRDATVVREALRKGLIDVWTEQDLRYWHSAYDTPALEKGWLKKIRRNFGIEIGIRRAVAFNLRRDRFKDRRVRLALTLAMDFEWQNRTLHYGYQQRAHSYWQDTDLAAVGLPSEGELALLEDYRDQLPPELFTEPFRFDEVASPEEHRANMLRARDLLGEAGWKVRDGMLRDQDGEPFEIEFLSQNPEDARTLLPYFPQLEQLGIVPTYRLTESSQFINRLREFDFDGMLRNSDILLPPIIELKSSFHSESAMEPLSRNPAGISHPALDFLIEKAVLATTMAQIIESCRAIDRVLLWQYYQIPLHVVDRPRTVHWDKFGQPAVEPKYWPAFPDGWWYDHEKAARIDIDL